MWLWSNTFFMCSWNPAAMSPPGMYIYIYICMYLSGPLVTRCDKHGWTAYELQNPWGEIWSLGYAESPCCRRDVHLWTNISAACKLLSARNEHITQEAQSVQQPKYSNYLSNSNIDIAAIHGSLLNMNNAIEKRGLNKNSFTYRTKPSANIQFLPSQSSTFIRTDSICQNGSKGKIRCLYLLHISQ